MDLTDQHCEYSSGAEEDQHDGCRSISDRAIAGILDEIRREEAANYLKKYDGELEEEQKLKILRKVLQHIGQKDVKSVGKVMEAQKEAPMSPQAFGNSTKNLMTTKAQTVETKEAQTIDQRLPASPAISPANKSLMPMSSQLSYKHSQTSAGDPSLVEGLIDPKKDTVQEVALIRQMGLTLSQPAGKRKKDELQYFSSIFLRYKFFKELFANHGQNTLLNVLSHVHLTKVEAGSYLIDQEDEGDRFYVILKGRMGVEIVQELKVPDSQKAKLFKQRIYAYLHCLLENFEKIFWRRVPYAIQIRNYLFKIKQDREQELLRSSNDAGVHGKSRLSQQPKNAPNWKDLVSRINSKRHVDSTQQLAPPQMSITEQDPEQDGGQQAREPPVASILTNRSGKDQGSGLQLRSNQPSQQSQQLSTLADHVDNPSRSSKLYQTLERNEPSGRSANNSNLLPRKPISGAKQNISLAYKSFEEQKIQMNDKLYSRLQKLDEVFDFSVFYMNQEVAELEPGQQFGDVALNTAMKRQASIFIKDKDSFLAFLEKEDYQKVLRQAYYIDMQRRFQVLQCNNFFQHLSNKKFQKIQYNLKRFKIQKNQVLYNEDDQVDGLYLILKGSVIYKKKIKVEIPVTSKTKNKWFKDEIKFQGINSKRQNKEVAIFENNEIVGFEELLREFILTKKQEDAAQDESIAGRGKSKPKIKVEEASRRDFSCVGYSLDTELLFFSIDILSTSPNGTRLFQLHDPKFLEQLFIERRSILKNTLTSIGSCKERIAGAKANGEDQMGGDYFPTTNKKAQAGRAHQQARGLTQSPSSLSNSAAPLSLGSQSPHRQTIKFVRIPQHSTSVTVNPLTLENKSSLQNSRRPSRNSSDQQSSRTLRNIISRTNPTLTNIGNTPLSSVQSIDSSQESNYRPRPKISFRDKLRNAQKAAHAEAAARNGRANDYQDDRFRGQKADRAHFQFLSKTQQEAVPLKSKRRVLAQNDYSPVKLPEIKAQSQSYLQPEKGTTVVTSTYQLGNSQASQPNLTQSQSSESFVNQLSPDRSTHLLKGQMSGLINVTQALQTPQLERRLRNQRDSQRTQALMPKYMQSCTSADELRALKLNDSGIPYDSLSALSNDHLSRPSWQYPENMQTQEELDFQAYLLNKDSSQLYLKDLKTFIGLKRVAESQNTRKMQEDNFKQEDRNFKNLNNEQMLVRTQIGTKDRKIIYDQGVTNHSVNASTQAEKEMNVRLYSIFQSLDLDAFENYDPEMKKARNMQSLDQSMQDIDDTFNALDVIERKMNHIPPAITSQDNDPHYQTMKPKKVVKKERYKMKRPKPTIGALRSFGKLSPIKRQDHGVDLDCVDGFIKGDMLEQFDILRRLIGDAPYEEFMNNFNAKKAKQKEGNNAHLLDFAKAFATEANEGLIRQLKQKSQSIAGSSFELQNLESLRIRPLKSDNQDEKELAPRLQKQVHQNRGIIKLLDQYISAIATRYKAQASKSPGKQAKKGPVSFQQSQKKGGVVVERPPSQATLQTSSTNNKAQHQTNTHDYLANDEDDNTAYAITPFIQPNELSRIPGIGITNYPTPAPGHRQSHHSNSKAMMSSHSQSSSDSQGARPPKGLHEVLESKKISVQDQRESLIVIRGVHANLTGPVNLKAGGSTVRRAAFGDHAAMHQPGGQEQSEYSKEVLMHQVADSEMGRTANVNGQDRQGISQWRREGDWARRQSRQPGQPSRSPLPLNETRNDLSILNEDIVNPLQEVYESLKLDRYRGMVDPALLVIEGKTAQPTQARSPAFQAIGKGPQRFRLARNQDIVRQLGELRSSASSIQPIQLLKSMAFSAEKYIPAASSVDGSFEEWAARCNRLPDTKHHQRLVLDGISNAMFRHNRLARQQGLSFGDGLQIMPQRELAQGEHAPALAAHQEMEMKAHLKSGSLTQRDIHNRKRAQNLHVHLAPILNQAAVQQRKRELQNLDFHPNIKSFQSHYQQIASVKQTPRERLPRLQSISLAHSLIASSDQTYALDESSYTHDSLEKRLARQLQQQDLQFGAARVQSLGGSSTGNATEQVDYSSAKQSAVERERESKRTTRTTKMHRHQVSTIDGREGQTKRDENVPVTPKFNENLAPGIKNKKPKKAQQS